MPYAPALPTIAEAIQASLSPVFMLTGIGALLNVLTGRLARVIDRARVLEERHPALQRDDRTRASRRMKVINASLFLAVASAVATCTVVAMLFVGALTRYHIGQWVAFSFILAMSLLIAAFVAFMVEVRLSIHAIRVRDELLR
jgi:MFS family permease